MSRTLLDELKKDFKQTQKKNGWAMSVMTQGFRIPAGVAQQVLEEKLPCQIVDRDLVIQTD